MKLLILCALVAVAAAYTPSEGDFSCLMCGDPLIRTADGVYMSITGQTKTLLLKSTEDDDHCKISIHCVTHTTYYADDADSPAWIDWCGVGFWQHKNPTKTFRNWMLAQDYLHFGQRGQGNDGIIGCPEVSVAPTTYTFPIPGENTSSWKKVKQPSEYCPDIPDVYSMYRDEEGVHFRSSCCKWAIDWYPAGRDTCINIWVPADNPHVGQMKGLCGNMNGNAIDDWQTCDTHEQLEPNTVASMAAITGSCMDSTHDGGSYNGGTKLWGSCGNSNNNLPEDLPTWQFTSTGEN